MPASGVYRSGEEALPIRRGGASAAMSTVGSANHTRAGVCRNGKQGIFFFFFLLQDPDPIDIMD